LKAQHVVDYPWTGKTKIDCDQVAENRPARDGMELNAGAGRRLLSISRRWRS
jgi:hypothetical protein